MKQFAKNVILPMFAGWCIGVITGWLIINLEWIVLFEDGSVQLFHDTQLGYCLIPSWGCSP